MIPAKARRSFPEVSARRWKPKARAQLSSAFPASSDLKAPCAVHNPYCTIAGQTAPGDGICLANYSGAGAYGTHDVIIRYLRFRIGDAANKAMDGAGLGSCDHCIMDHCSISWSSDEGTSSRGANNITFQRNIVAEALHHGPHYRASDRTKLETHAFAGSISGNIGSYHHNLLADCTDRNWSLAGGLTQGGKYAGYLDIRNNVVYNWTARTTDGGVKELNYVNNYYKPYPPNPFVKWLLKLDPINPAWGTESYYMAGNVLEGFVDETNNWSAFANGRQGREAGARGRRVVSVLCHNADCARGVHQRAGQCRREFSEVGRG